MPQEGEWGAVKCAEWSKRSVRSWLALVANGSAPAPVREVNGVKLWNAREVEDWADEHKSA